MIDVYVVLLVYIFYHENLCSQKINVGEGALHYPIPVLIIIIIMGEKVWK